MKGKNNFGFVFCELDEKISPYRPGEHPPVSSFSEEKKLLLNEKNLWQAFEDKIIHEIKRDRGRILFFDYVVSSPYMIIDGCKVLVSYSVAALTEEQIIRELDLLTFYFWNRENERNWFRLGLPYLSESAIEEPAFL